MANNSIFYDDPPPVQQRRFVPIPAQGQQPPKSYPALAMSVVLSSWPTGLEYQPYQRVSAVVVSGALPNQPPPRKPDNLSIQNWPVDYYQQQRSIFFVPPPLVVSPYQGYEPYPIGAVLSWQTDPWPMQQSASRQIVSGPIPPQPSPSIVLVGFDSNVINLIGYN